MKDGKKRRVGNKRRGKQVPMEEGKKKVRLRGQGYIGNVEELKSW